MVGETATNNEGNVLSKKVSKNVGSDRHQLTCQIAVHDEEGKALTEAIVETRVETIRLNSPAGTADQSDFSQKVIMVVQFLG